jgi:glycerol-3-phosphate dehydrogenase subunit C
MKETRDVAVKVGKPTARQVVQKGNETLCSDCPLACKHLGQLVSAQVGKEGPAPKQAHPIEVLASAYGFKG